MAGLAYFGGTFKNAAFMAGLTFQGRMGTGQGITGFIVVKFGKIGAGTVALHGQQCGKNQ